MELNEAALERMVRESIENLLAEAMSADDVYAKYYADMNRSMFDAAVKADPTSKNGHAGRYVKWILNLAKNGNWKPGDSTETFDALSKFHRMKGSLQNGDINAYSSVKAVLDAVSGKKTNTDIKKNEAEKVYEDRVWLVVVPHTEEASKLYGKGTRWCTAADEDNMFDYYNQKGPLYININKKTGEKYQFHFPSAQFMDDDDNEVELGFIGLTDGIVNFYEKIHNGFSAMVMYNANSVGDFHDGIAIIYVDAVGNYVNKEYKLLSPDKWYDEVGDFSEGLGKVYDAGTDMYYYMKTDGTLLNNGEGFDEAWPFYGGFAKIGMSGKFNFIRPDGSLLRENDWFDNALNMFGELGYAFVEWNGGIYRLMKDGYMVDWPGENPFDKRSKYVEPLYEAMDMDSVYSKYYNSMDRRVFDAAVKADPTSKGNHAGKYVKWIMSLAMAGKWKPGDTTETRDALSRFDRMKGSMEVKDINRYKSVMELLKAVSGLKSTNDIKGEGAEKVYEDSEWLVVVPHTEEASKLYGKGTKWCTAADDNNMFDYYNEKGLLYINIRKRDGQKWQFHFETHSFMNDEDDSVKVGNIGLSGGLIKFYEKICPYFKAVREYDYIDDFKDGLAAVKLNGKFNFIDTNGELISPNQWFDYCLSFRNGFTIVEVKGKLNFIDKNGNILLPNRWFDRACQFRNGFAKIAIGDNVYKLSTNGKLYTIDGTEEIILESTLNRKLILNNEQRWHIICEAMSAKEIHGKYYQDVPNLTFMLAMKADPTSMNDHPGRYVKWILELWRNSSWMPIEWERTNMVLKRFEKAKPHMENQDINRYRSMDELEDAIDSVNVPDSTTDIKNKGSEKVYEDDKWLVVRLDTWEASKLYGAGTKWCTSESEPDAFDAYNGQGKLYVNIRKGDKAKFLIFLSKSGYGTEFKDAADQDTSFNKIGATEGLLKFYQAMDWKPDTAAKVAGLMETNKPNRNIVLTEDQEWRLLCEAMSIQNIHDKYYPDIDMDIFRAAVMADPTSSDDKAGRYVKWICNLIRKGKWGKPDAPATLEVLTKFDHYHDRMENNDINRYDSLDTLAAAIDTVDKSMSATEIKTNGSQKEYEDSEWLIIWVYSRDAMKLYGKGTKWCVSADENNRFDDYSMRGSLYLNIRKRDNAKFLFYFDDDYEDIEFRDAMDEYVNPDTIGLTEGAVKYYHNMCPNLIGMSLLKVNNADEGLFRAKSWDGNWTFIDDDDKPFGNGNQWYSFVSDFHEGIAVVYKLNSIKMSYVRPDGSMLVDTWFEQCRDFSDGMGAVRTSMGWTYLDMNGKVFPCRMHFLMARDFNEGVAAVKTYNGWSYITKDGKLLRPECDFQAISTFRDGHGVAMGNDGVKYAIDINGNLSSPTREDNSRLLLSENESVETVKKNIILTEQQEWRLLCEAMSPDDIYAKYYNDIPREVFDKAMESDPTSRSGKAGRYVKWLINRYKTGNWDPNDSERTKRILSMFTNFHGTGLDKDINRYRSIQDVENAISGSDRTETQKEKKRSGADKVYEDDTWIIVIPRTEEAAKLYGANTKWCTAADKDNMFGYYNERGPLYININKKTGRKYQFFFSKHKDEYMDELDTKVAPYTIGLTQGAADYYGSIGHFSDVAEPNLALVRGVEDVKSGKNPKEVFNVQFETDGLYCIKFGDMENYMDKNGNFLSERWFQACMKFYDGIAKVMFDDFSEGWLKRDGSVLGNRRFSEVYGFHDGWSRTVVSVDDGSAMNYIDRNGNMAFAEDVVTCSDFNDGFASVYDGEKAYFMNPKLEQIGPSFTTVFKFINGFGIGYKEGLGYTYVTSNGNILGDKWFEEVRPFDRAGKALVIYDGHYYRFYNTGELVPIV